MFKVSSLPPQVCQGAFPARGCAASVRVLPLDQDAVRARTERGAEEQTGPVIQAPTRGRLWAGCSTQKAGE